MARKTHAPVTTEEAQAALAVIRAHREHRENVTAKAANDAMKTLDTYIRQGEAQERARAKRLGVKLDSEDERRRMGLIGRLEGS
jgi:uncharacterized protein (DUF934 family)